MLLLRNAKYAIWHKTVLSRTYLGRVQHCAKVKRKESSSAVWDSISACDAERTLPFWLVTELISPQTRLLYNHSVIPMDFQSYFCFQRFYFCTTYTWTTCRPQKYSTLQSSYILYVPMSMPLAYHQLSLLLILSSHLTIGSQLPSRLLPQQATGRNR